MSKQKKSQDEVKNWEARLSEAESKWKRALADYQNLEKRIAAQQANFIKLASVESTKKLLPIIDDLKRAQEHLKDAGIEMILKQLEEMLRSEGVEKMEVSGKDFDPVQMECVEMVEGEENKVMKVVIDGYKMGDLVIRPAKVEVGRQPKKEN